MTISHPLLAKQKMKSIDCQRPLLYFITKHSSFMLFRGMSDSRFALFFLNDFIYVYFMCICVLLTCVYTTKTRRRQGAGSPGTWVASSCVLPYGCQESSQGLLRKQQGPFNHRAIFPALSSFVLKLTFELVEEHFLYAECGSSHL